MASIPLPALDLKPPAPPPDALQQVGRIMQLKQMMQNAPLQNQALQQQVQAGGMENQQRQMALNDQKAMTTAMQQWDGKDLNQLPTLVLKNGGSAQAVMGLKAKSLEMKKQFSDIAAQDATTGSKNIETLMKKNDVISGAFSTVLQAPDAQLPQAVVSTAQQLSQQGLLDPQHLQMAQQIAQTGDPAQIRQQLDTMRKGMLATSQIMSQAKDQAQTAESQTSTRKNQAELDYYARNGGAPGVSAEMQQQTDWLKKNPGKGPSDFLLWKQRNSPSAVVMGNMFAGAENQGGLDIAANNYRLTGQLPSMYKSPESIKAVINRAAELDQEAGGHGVAVNKTMLDADKTSLANLTKFSDSVQAFEQTAQKNIGLLKDAAKDIPDLGAKFANVPVRAITGNMIGTAKMARFQTALNVAQTESAKVLNNPNSSAVLSDSARGDLQKLVDGNMTYPAMMAALETLQKDMNNRTESNRQQIESIQNRLRNTGSGGGNQPSGNTSSDPFAQFGGKAH